MGAKKQSVLNPIFWGILLFVVAQILILLLASRINPFLEDRNIYVPSQPPETITLWPGEITLPSGQVTEVPAYSSLGPVLIYILAAAAMFGLVLSLIPLRALKFVLRFMFALLFSWGAFIATVFYLPLPLAIIIAAIIGGFWFLRPFLWLHNLALILALASLGAVFGRFITVWTGMALILLMAIYDFLAVRFGFMLWLANRLSQVSALPALIVPKNRAEWSLNLRQSGAVDSLETKSDDRKYSILGGGDIAFPGLLTASVYFSQGLAPGVMIAAFGLIGLVCAYLIQVTVLKGKPIPALPPIAILTLIGLIIVS
jgi:presenilin-like A22 family membrane protease